MKEFLEVAGTSQHEPFAADQETELSRVCVSGK